ncbi:hypothetical protein QTP88_007259 [Uroleucon formosanum]
MMHANRQWPFQRSGSNGNSIVYGVDYNHDDGGGADDDDDAAAEEFGDFGGDPIASGRRYLTIQPKQWCTSYVAANRQHYRGVQNNNIIEESCARTGYIKMLKLFC